VTTLDIVSKLRPDVAGSVLSMPFEDAAFDVVACFEVLEHLPYDDFPKALEELSRVSRKHVVLSVPDHTAVYRVNIELPRMKPIKRLVSHPFPRPPFHEFDGEHYWIIGKSNYPLEKISHDIGRKGFRIIETYRPFEFYGHRFFSLEKS
jgi:ubiquinone/menaquinone biosynthesis C-methylase UbiE